MTGYFISDIVKWGVCLLDFDNNDWSYDPHIDVVYVREGSKLYTWLALVNRQKQQSFWQV
jgi:hypothetical protein